MTSRESRSRPPERTAQQLPEPPGGGHGTVRRQRFVRPLAERWLMGCSRGHEPSLFTSSKDHFWPLQFGRVCRDDSPGQQQPAGRRVARITFALLFVSPVAARLLGWLESQLASQFANSVHDRRRVGSSPWRCCFPSPSWRLSICRPTSRKRFVASLIVSLAVGAKESSIGV